MGLYLNYYIYLEWEIYPPKIVNDTTLQSTESTLSFQLSLLYLYILYNFIQFIFGLQVKIFPKCTIIPYIYIYWFIIINIIIIYNYIYITPTANTILQNINNIYRIGNVYYYFIVILFEIYKTGTFTNSCVKVMHVKIFKLMINEVSQIWLQHYFT